LFFALPALELAGTFLIWTVLTMIATPAQLMAARLLLGYKTRVDVAVKLRMTPDQVRRGERLEDNVMGLRLQAFYEASGVEFIAENGGDAGVKFRGEGK
jgi:hypothetical protein